MEHGVKLLKTTFNRKGFEYFQKYADERTYIYAKVLNGQLISFECFSRRVRKARTINGQQLPAQEMFSNDEAFGKWAWDCKSEVQALQKINSVRKSE